MKMFKSGFAMDLENMIALKVATNFSESTYMERAKTFDSFCSVNYPEDFQLTETIVLNWLKDSLDNKTRNVAHSRLSFCRTFGEYQKAIGKNHSFHRKKCCLEKVCLFHMFSRTKKFQDCFGP